MQPIGRKPSREPSPRRQISAIGLKSIRSHSSRMLPSFQESSRFASIRGSILSNSRRSDASDIKSHRPSQSSTVPYDKLQPTEQLQKLFTKHSNRLYVRNLIEYNQRNWDEEGQKLVKEQKFKSLAELLLLRNAQFCPLLQDFLILDYNQFSEIQRKLLVSVHYKEYVKLSNALESNMRELLGRVPSDRQMKQQQQLFQLFRILLKMYDVKNVQNPDRMRESVMQLGENFAERKNELIGGAGAQLRLMTDVLCQVQKYFSGYVRQLTRQANNVKGFEKRLAKTQQLLDKKVLYTPVQLDYQRIKDIRDEQKKEIFSDFQKNIVKFHEVRAKQMQQIIEQFQKKQLQLQNQIRQKDESIADLRVEINRLTNMRPTMCDAETQLHQLPLSRLTPDLASQPENTSIQNFLDNVGTPFQLSISTANSLINIFLVDKILYDYELIKQKALLKPVRLFLYQWFIIKCGSKKVAQVLCKNFVQALAQLRRDNKRHHLFSKLAGFIRSRKKNLQEDLDLIFHQTQLAWYYYVKLALAYRRKLNENPSGYPIVPPVSTEDIMRISLRKTYEIIDEFFQSQGIEKPEDLHTKIDLYSINEISKFKQHNEQFQKQQLQQIHILRQINFDTICGFVIEYVSSLRCGVIEKFLRALQIRQRQKKRPVTYVEFQAILKRFYKQKRSKIQLIFSKLAMTNQNSLLDVDNVRPLVQMLVQDESKTRSLFDKMESLKVLIMSQKAAIKWMEKRTSHPNSFQNFRQRFYLDFFDFYDSTSLISDIYGSIRHLVRKLIFKESGRDKDIAVDDAIEAVQEQKKEDEQSEKSEEQEPQVKPKEQVDAGQLERKVQEFRTIFTKVPKFAKRIITIDQMLVHNVRRKDCIDATEYTWRVLRDIMMYLADHSDLL